MNLTELRKEVSKLSEDELLNLRSIYKWYGNEKRKYVETIEQELRERQDES